jgi:hypothetical protein
MVSFVTLPHLVSVAALSERLEALNHTRVGGFWVSATCPRLLGLLISPLVSRHHGIISPVTIHCGCHCVLDDAEL